jgi:hypothetical protein
MPGGFFCVRPEDQQAAAQKYGPPVVANVPHS